MKWQRSTIFISKAWRAATSSTSRSCSRSTRRRCLRKKRRNSWETSESWCDLEAQARSECAAIERLVRESRESREPLRLPSLDEIIASAFDLGRQLSGPPQIARTHLQRWLKGGRDPHPPAQRVASNCARYELYSRAANRATRNRRTARGCCLDPISPRFAGRDLRTCLGYETAVLLGIAAGDNPRETEVAMDPKRFQRLPQAKVFTEAEYRADAAKVIAHAAETGSAIVARADGTTRFMIAIPAAEPGTEAAG